MIRISVVKVRSINMVLISLCGRLCLGFLVFLVVSGMFLMVRKN